jgi:DNA-binding NtrC family response regulator
MIRILIAGGDRSTLSAFKTALDESDAQITCLASGRRALSAISERGFDLLVADEHLGDMTGLELIRSVVAGQPMLNCAVVSSLSPGDFHEASEGLGILMQLPVAAGKKEADGLLEHLRKINSFGKKIHTGGDKIS